MTRSARGPTIDVLRPEAFDDPVIPPAEPDTGDDILSDVLEEVFDYLGLEGDFRLSEDYEGPPLESEPDTPDQGASRSLGFNPRVVAGRRWADRRRATLDQLIELLRNAPRTRVGRFLERLAKVIEVAGTVHSILGLITAGGDPKVQTFRRTARERGVGDLRLGDDPGFADVPRVGNSEREPADEPPGDSEGGEDPPVPDWRTTRPEPAVPDARGGRPEPYSCEITDRPIPRPEPDEGAPYPDWLTATPEEPTPDAGESRGEPYSCEITGGPGLEEPRLGGGIPRGAEDGLDLLGGLIGGGREGLGEDPEQWDPGFDFGRRNDCGFEELLSGGDPGIAMPGPGRAFDLDHLPEPGTGGGGAAPGGGGGPRGGGDGGDGNRTGSNSQEWRPEDDCFEVGNERDDDPSGGGGGGGVQGTAMGEEESDTDVPPSSEPGAPDSDDGDDNDGQGDDQGDGWLPYHPDTSGSGPRPKQPVDDEEVVNSIDVDYVGQPCEYDEYEPPIPPRRERDSCAFDEDWDLWRGDGATDEGCAQWERSAGCDQFEGCPHPVMGDGVGCAVSDSGCEHQEEEAQPFRRGSGGPRGARGCAVAEGACGIAAFDVGDAYLDAGTMAQELAPTDFDIAEERVGLTEAELASDLSDATLALASTRLASSVGLLRANRGDEGAAAGAPRAGGARSVSGATRAGAAASRVAAGAAPTSVRTSAQSAALDTRMNLIDQLEREDT